MHDANGCMNRGVAGTLGRSADERRHLTDSLNVRYGHPNVFTSGESPAYPINKSSIGVQECSRLEYGRIANNNRLTTAAREIGESTLVGHRAGKPKGVIKRLIVRQIRLESRSPSGRATRSRMDCDNNPKLGRLVMENANLLMTIKLV
jgi:hypothetical protein